MTRPALSTCSVLSVHPSLSRASRYDNPSSYKPTSSLLLFVHKPASQPERQVPCLSHARTLSPLNAHTYCTHADTKIAACLSSQPCASRAWRQSAVSMCLRGCRGTRPTGLHSDRHADGSRKSRNSAPSEWTRSRRESKHAAVPPTQAVLACIIEGTVPCASCSLQRLHASCIAKASGAATSDE